MWIGNLWQSEVTCTWGLAYGGIHTAFSSTGHSYREIPRAFLLTEAAGCGPCSARGKQLFSLLILSKTGFLLPCLKQEITSLDTCVGWKESVKHMESNTVEFPRVSILCVCVYAHTRMHTGRGVGAISNWVSIGISFTQFPLVIGCQWGSNYVQNIPAHTGVWGFHWVKPKKDEKSIYRCLKS